MPKWANLSVKWRLGKVEMPKNTKCKFQNFRNTENFLLLPFVVNLLHFLNRPPTPSGRRTRLQIVN